MTKLMTLVAALALTIGGCRDRSQEGKQGRDDKPGIYSLDSEADYRGGEEKLDWDDGEETGGTGEKMALEEGKMGKEDSRREAGRYALENKHVDPQLARKKAMDKARASGVAGALQGDTFGKLSLGKGGDGRGEADSIGGSEKIAQPRAWFPETFLFEPLLVTNASGDGETRVTVPDRLTTWRVLALAHSRSGAQAGTVASFVGTLPTYVDPVLPPFLFAGDSVRIPIQLVNTTAAPVVTNLKLAASGARLTGGQGAVTIPAEGSVVRYATITTDQPGTLKFSARLGETDAVLHELPIKPTGMPVTHSENGTLAAPRTFTMTGPARSSATLDQVHLQVFPGALAILRSELGASIGRRGVAEDGFALLLAGKAPELLAALGDEPDAAALRKLTILATQRVVRHARRLDITSATLLADAAGAHADNPVLSAIATRAVEFIARNQLPDGTCSGDTGWTLQRLFVATADCARAGKSAPSVVVRASGAFERYADKIDDPYTAAAILASGAATGKLAETLRKIVLAEIKTLPTGAKELVVPSGVVRADGVTPSSVEATAMAILALDGVAGAPTADLGATILASYSPYWGWGDGRTNLVAMQAVLRLFKDPIPDNVAIALTMDGAEIATGKLSRDSIREILMLEAAAVDASGAHEWKVVAEPAVAGLGFALELTSWVAWPAASAKRGLELSLTPPPRLVVGEKADIAIRAVAPGDVAFTIRHALPAGVQIDSAALEELVEEGILSSFVAADGKIELKVPGQPAGQMLAMKLVVIPTLSGTLHTGASSIEVDDTVVHLPPTRWRIGK